MNNFKAYSCIIKLNTCLKTYFVYYYYIIIHNIYICVYVQYAYIRMYY